MKKTPRFLFSMFSTSDRTCGGAPKSSYTWMLGVIDPSSEIWLKKPLFLHSFLTSVEGDMVVAVELP
jgi:hypothetical protein